MRHQTLSRLLSASSISAIALYASLMPGGNGALRAQVVAANGNTQVGTADNGVPMVQIANPNANGLSVNQYDAFNVSTRGIILNNATSAEGNAEGRVTTQLAGLVAVNPNLTTAAKVILNEVVSTNPSVLAGYMEVAGTKAEVVVANPNGITCGGCGVINTSVFTLATGRSRIDSSGGLLGFDVSSGTLTINGAGLDAQTTDYAALLGRKIAIGGATFGKVLDVVAGSNRWDYQNRRATAIAGTGTTPDYAIDSTAVGGIYANRIRLIATEAGVGVRLLADAAAVADDLTLSAAGNLELRSTISAAQDLKISTSGTGGLVAQDASLSAGRDLGLAIAGSAALTGGAIVATRDLSLTSASLTDTGSAATLPNNNQRYAGGSLTLGIGGAIALTGTSYGAAGVADISGSSLAANGDGFLYSSNNALSVKATTGDLTLGSYALTAASRLALNAGGAVSVRAGRGGIVSSGGPVEITAGAGLDNAGTIAANAGAVTLSLGGNSTNSGSIVAQGNLTLADAAGGASGSLTNASGGQILSNGAIDARLATLVNAGTVQAASGTTLRANRLENTGLFIASTATTADGTITAASVTNAGTLQSARDLTLGVSGTLDNSGTMNAASALALTGQAATTNAGAGVISAKSVNLAIASLDNSGKVIGADRLTLDATGAVSNRATIGTNGTLALAAGSLSNLTGGTVQSGIGGNIATGGALLNQGAIYLANTSGNGTVAAGSLDNQSGAVLVSQGDLDLTLSGTSLTNAGNLLASRSLSIRATGTALMLTNAGGAYIQSGSASGDKLTITGAGIALETAPNSVITGNSLDLTLARMTNAGAISAVAGLNFAASGAVSNAGVLLAGTQLTGRGGTVSNLASGGIQGGSGVALTSTGTLTNAGTILTPSANGGTGAVALTAGTFDNQAGAIVQSAGGLSLALTGTGGSNAGTLLSAGTLALSAGTGGATLTNRASGIIAAQGSSASPATLSSSGQLSLVNIAGGRLLGDRLALSLAALDNAGAIGGGAGANSIIATGAVTNSGTLVLTSDNAGSATLGAGLLTNTGSIGSNGTLALNLSAGLANSSTIQSLGDFTIASGSNSVTLTNSTAGRLLSGGTLAITGNGAAFTDQAGQIGGNALAFTIASLTNSGSIVSTNAADIAVSGALATSGLIGSNGTLTLSAGTLDVAAAGRLQSEVAGAVTVSGRLSNNGQIYLANTSGTSTLSLGSASVAAGARIVSGGKLGLAFTGSSQSLDNAGLIAAGDDIAITGSNLAINNQTGATIQTSPAGASTTGLITINGGGISLTNRGVIIGNSLNWAFGAISNFGTLQSRGNLTLAFTGASENSGTLYAQDGIATFSGASFSNNAGAILQADKGTTFNLTGNLANAGTLIGSTDGIGNLVVNAASLANLAPGASASAATIQSSKGASFNLNGPAFDNTGYVITSADMAIHGTGAALAITNSGSGIIAAQGTTAAPATLTIDGTATTLTNAAGAAITADATALTLAGMTNAGQFVTGTGASAITISGTLTNSGTFLTNGTLNLTANEIDNQLRAVFAPQDATITLGSSLSSAGTFFVPGNLNIRSINGDNRALTIRVPFFTGPGGSTGSDGLFQIGGTLDVLAVGADFAVGGGATLLVDSAIRANVRSFRNFGTMQAAVNSNIITSEEFLNQGNAYFVGTNIADTASISSGSFRNAGLLESGTSLSLSTINGNLLNDLGGTIRVNREIKLGASANSTQVINNGLLEGDSIATILVRDFVFGANAKAVSNSFGYVALPGVSGTRLSIGSGASISARNAFNIAIDTFEMADSSSQLLGGNQQASSLSVTNSFTVRGLIFGEAGLNVRGFGDITLASNSGVASGGSTSIIAKPATFGGQSGSIVNSGQIYGAAAVNLEAGASIVNKANTDSASSASGFAGSIDSGGSISLSTNEGAFGYAGSVINYSQINAAGDITINSRNFTNAVVGDWSRVSSQNTVISAQPVSTNVAPNGSCSGVGTSTTLFDCENFFTQTWNQRTVDTERFANGLIAPSYTPQIVSTGGTLRVNFRNANNVGARLSAPVVSLSALESGATFGLNTLELRQTVTDMLWTRSGFQRYRLDTSQNPPTGVRSGEFLDYFPQFTCAGGPTYTCGGDGIGRSASTAKVFGTGGGSLVPTGVFANSVTGGGYALTVIGAAGNTTPPAVTAAGNALNTAIGSRTGSTTAPTGTSGSTTGIAAPTASVAATGATGTTGTSGTGLTPTAGLTVDTATSTSGLSSGAGSATPLASTASTNFTNPISVTTVGGQPAVSFDGTTVALPSNPNGRFVTVPNPTSQFLVESNPLFTTPIASFSSDLLAQRLGIAPDAFGKRLGDTDYEAYLITQQLLGATGRSLLSSYATLDDQLSALYANAADYAQQTGLVIGQPLTEEQAANLPGDIIWLVRTEVAGQSVLAPVVYLSEATKTALVSGSGIIADSVNLQLTSLNNDGGQIIGTKTNVIRTTGDIRNTNGGVIAGGQVYLKSASGSVQNLNSTIQAAKTAVVIANEDLVNTNGTIAADRIALRSDDTRVDIKGGTITAGTALSVDQMEGFKVDGTNNISAKNLALTTRGGSIEVVTQTDTRGIGTKTIRTEVGPTAAITATESLSLNAAKDISVKGGTISAGKDLVLNAGNNIDIGTVTSTEGDVNQIKKGRTTTTSEYVTTTNIGSDVSAGGNLVLKSGGSTNITGSNVTAGGNAAIISEGEVNITAATDTSRTKTVEKYSGVFQKKTTTTEVETTTNVGSNVTTGGSLYVKSGGDTNITGGSQINAGKNVVIDTSGNDLNILAGNDTSTTTTEMKKSGLGVAGGLYGKEKVNTRDASATNVASGITAGGKVALINNDNVTIQGSNLSAAEGGVIDATGNVNVLAGKDTRDVTTRRETETILGVSSSSSGKASANAGALAERNGIGGTASAGASASAEGENKSSLNFYSKTVTNSREQSTTNVGSNIEFGGDSQISAGKTLTIQGSNVGTTEGDLTLRAKDVNILTGIDSETSSSDSRTTSIGIFVDSKGDASAAANAEISGSLADSKNRAAIGGGASASATAEANGQVTATIGVRNSTSRENSVKVGNVGSNISAGGNLNIIAENDITTVGANLSAGGDVAQVAGNNINNLAAQDYEFSSQSESETTAGLYLRANGSASAEASAGASAKIGQTGISTPAANGLKVGAEASAEVSAGFRAANEASSSSSGSTSAVSTTIKSGGNVVRIASNAINDQGTQLQSGGDILQQATTITDRAAENTEFSTENSRSTEFTIGANVQGGVSGGMTSGSSTGAGIKQTFTYEQSGESQRSSEAVTSSYDAGGKVVSITSGKTSLEGTQIKGQQGVTIQAGSLDYTAARNTEQTSSSGFSLDQSVTVDVIAKSVGVGVEGEISKSSGSKNQAVTGTIESGAGAVNIVTTNGDLRLQATQVSGESGVNVAATNGKVVLEAARSTETTNDLNASFGVNLTASKGTGGANSAGIEVEAGLQIDKTDSVTNQTVQLNSGSGQVNVQGNSVLLQGTQIAAATGANVVATQGQVTNQSVVDTVRSSGGGFNISAAAEQSGTVVAGGTGGFNAYNVTDRTTTTSSVTSQSGGTFVGRSATPVIAPQLAGGVDAPTIRQVDGVPDSNVSTSNAADSNSFSAPVGQTNGSSNAAGAVGSRQTSALAVPGQAAGRISGIAAPAAAPVVAIGAAPIAGAAVSQSIAQGATAAAPQAMRVEGVTATVQGATPLQAPLALAVPKAAPLSTGPQAVAPVPVAKIDAGRPATITPVPQPAPTPPAGPDRAQTPTDRPLILPTVQKQPDAPVITPTVQKQPDAPVIQPTVQKQPDAPVITPTVQKQPDAPVITPTVQKQPDAPVIKPTVQKQPDAPVIQPTVQKQPDAPVMTPTVQKQPDAPAIQPTVQKQPDVPVMTSTVQRQPEAPATMPQEQKQQSVPSTTTPVVPMPENTVRTVVDREQNVIRPEIAPPPAGKPITAQTAAGGELPCWLTIDPRTGAINGRPSQSVADANVPVIVIEMVPQADGTTRRMTIVVQPNQFGAGGSECSIVRTNPTADKKPGQR
ncbi:filamentous hemagglutinin N-terminal domain-containing protein [Novosphingobium sp. ERN07]|uniref:two-partner secretion domain-containing protein n=1 Tax=Novosphingobium sp. ERN07 TaxID=2726187 RepID=UPI001456E568|nr:hemagglutinin repeat-containing protein [Novosphingobium sp. ERN07]NLR71753.1 filamentous hemagglutinin N-terminal domain-containing protein [Novosphingobium sp. ERN07]